jgi:hypothetical protein
MASVMSDDWLEVTISSLAEMLQTNFPLRLQPPPVRQAIARPSEPPAQSIPDAIPVAKTVELTAAELAALPVAAPLSPAHPLEPANVEAAASLTPVVAETQSESDAAAEQHADDVFVSDLSDTDADFVRDVGEDDLIFEEDPPPG